jgi:hypothetical protein
MHVGKCVMWVCVCVCVYKNAMPLETALHILLIPFNQYDDHTSS